ncbi:hypothetical protein RF11_05784 [Thelohanellus kitauei]|uniref:Uncharacterized protein n=1 Tax=Thelohanellus kitauei TaxID=669202 RepID=A0A0C2IW40_THEKT|nr:hypothetical protein RF11_05784 [Thelohanellus kitauei]
MSENLEITVELLSIESMKDTSTGVDILECVEKALPRVVNHTMFIRLLEDFGRVLRPVWEKKTETLLFSEIKGKDTKYLKLRELQWLSDLAFVIDLFEHLKDLNTNYKGMAFLIMKYTHESRHYS